MSIALGLLRQYAKLAPTERGGFRLARLARDRLPREQWQDIFEDGRGNRLALDLKTYPDVCMAVGLYERDTDRLLAKLLRPGGHFVDGGANLGYFTCRVARFVGPSGRVDAFEPDEQNRTRLLDNLDRNDLLDVVRVHAKALSDEAGSLRLFHPTGDDRNHGETSRYATGGEGEFADVPAVRLDEAVNKVPDVVKLDLEGGELAALAGASRWLAAERPPVFVVEHNPAADVRGGHRPGDIWRQLGDGWRCDRIRSWAAGHLRALPDADAVDVYPRQCNLLLRRR